MAITTWAAAGGDWEDSQYERAWDGPAISPDNADLTLSTILPTLKKEFFINPGVANLEIVQSYEWDQLTSSWVDSTGDWNTGPIPQMAVGTGVSPDKADLTFTAYSPEIGRMYNFVVSASTLTLTGSVPKDGTGFVISPDNASIQILQTYDWNNYGGTWAAATTLWDDVAFAPSAVETGQNQPDAGSLTLTGLVPTFQLSKLWYVPSGSLSITGFVPSALEGFNFSPSAGSLTGFGGGALWDDGTGDWASHTEAWGLGTLSPTLGVTYTFVIDPHGKLVFTPYDPQWPQVGDPNYISSVLIS